MFLLFALASVPATCFCSFIVGNSFSTMIPQVSRFFSTMIGASMGIILAVTGIAGDLIGFFGIVGASFGPICGAIAADLLVERSTVGWAEAGSQLGWIRSLGWRISNWDTTDSSGLVSRKKPFAACSALQFPCELRNLCHSREVWSGTSALHELTLIDVLN
jgi:hypothetical protein